MTARPLHDDETGACDECRQVVNLSDSKTITDDGDILCPKCRVAAKEEQNVSLLKALAYPSEDGLTYAPAVCRLEFNIPQGLLHQPSTFRLEFTNGIVFTGPLAGVELRRRAP